MNTTDTDPGRLRPPFTAATARDHIRHLLLTGAPGTLPVVVGDVLLVATEMITNAERHGGGMTAFDARLTEDTIVISVTDASPDVPRSTPRSNPVAPGGFGWPLIRRLSRHVAVTPTRTGKTIKVVIATGDRTAPVPEAQ